MISIVIPAHNEQTTIGRCLDGLLTGAQDGELDVVVVANGCSDDTAAVASDRAGVRIIELEPGSKALALNAGDAEATAYPRLYVDADVELDIEGVRALAATLAEPGVLAVSPALTLVAEESTWVVRSYHRIWADLPSIREGLAGRGVYGLSQEGRRRFERFPDLVADDGFVDGLFTADERRCVDSVRSRVRMPRRARELVARKSRSFAGGLQLAAAGHERRQSNVAWLSVLRRHPARLVDVPAYVAVTVMAKRRARRAASNETIEWARDDSTR